MNPTPLTSEEIFHFLQTHSFLKGLEEETLRRLTPLCYEVSYKKGELICRNGEGDNSAYIIVSGILRGSACSRSGRHITCLLATEGEAFNLLSLYYEQPRFLEGEALTPLRLLKIDGEDYISFIDDHPRMAIHILRWVAPALDFHITRMIKLQEEKVVNRIAFILGVLYRKFGNPITFSAAQVAEYAVTTTESALRAMAELRKRGVIEYRREEIVVLDYDGLKRADREG